MKFVQGRVRGTDVKEMIYKQNHAIKIVRFNIEKKTSFKKSVFFRSWEIEITAAEIC